MAKRPELTELAHAATRGSRAQFWLDQIAERRRQRNGPAWPAGFATGLVRGSGPNQWWPNTTGTMMWWPNTTGTMITNERLAAQTRWASNTITYNGTSISHT